jgi:hypothetical protein
MDKTDEELQCSSASETLQAVDITLRMSSSTKGKGFHVKSEIVRDRKAFYATEEDRDAFQYFCGRRSESVSVVTAT